MIVTEEEAKTKRCQESFGDGWTTPDGRMATMASASCSAVVASPSFCIASACMAWRWDKWDTHPETGQRLNGTLGYWRQSRTRVTLCPSPVIPRRIYPMVCGMNLHGVVIQTNQCYADSVGQSLILSLQRELGDGNHHRRPLHHARWSGSQSG